jgi:hypothetical protein
VAIVVVVVVSGGFITQLLRVRRELRRARRRSVRHKRQILDVCICVGEQAARVAPAGVRALLPQRDAAGSPEVQAESRTGGCRGGVQSPGYSSGGGREQRRISGRCVFFRFFDLDLDLDLEPQHTPNQVSSAHARSLLPSSLAQLL